MLPLFLVTLPSSVGTAALPLLTAPLAAVPTLFLLLVFLVRAAALPTSAAALGTFGGRRETLGKGGCYVFRFLSQVLSSQDNGHDIFTKVIFCASDELIFWQNKFEEFFSNQDILIFCLKTGLQIGLFEKTHG